MAWKVRQQNGTYFVYDDEHWYVMSCQDKQRAQLVASAPKMLEALEAIVDLHTDDLWRSTGIARAAMAAVKGEHE